MTSTGKPGPRVVMLPWLGGSAETWAEVGAILAGKGARPAALDLPGFGAAAADLRFDLPATIATVIAAVQALRAGEEEIPWLLAGHSMGGKVAACVARAAVEGAGGLANLAAVLLVSPSPPGPEPMEESKRQELLQTLGKRSGGPGDLAVAEKFVDDNTGTLPLPPPVRAHAARDVLRSSAAAFAAWLTTGSKEDMSGRVGVLTVPALILAGTEDAALGPAAQRRHTLPHFQSASVETLDGCGHLAPLEQPALVAERILQLLAGRNEAMLLNASFQALVDSDRTSPQTRARMRQRLQATPPAEPRLFNPTERALLTALCGRVVPGCTFDLAARCESRLQSGPGDGWRDARLPADVTAWQTGLRTLDAAARAAHHAGFDTLASTQQDALLSAAAEQNLHAVEEAGQRAATLFDAAQLGAWFEDVRGEMAKIYMADPRTMQQAGYTGFADEHGFTQIRLGELEEFER